MSLSQCGWGRVCWTWKGEAARAFQEYRVSPRHNCTNPEPETSQKRQHAVVYRRFQPIRQCQTKAQPVLVRFKYVSRALSRGVSVLYYLFCGRALWELCERNGIGNFKIDLASSSRFRFPIASPCPEFDSVRFGSTRSFPNSWVCVSCVLLGNWARNWQLVGGNARTKSEKRDEKVNFSQVINREELFHDFFSKYFFRRPSTSISIIPSSFSYTFQTSFQFNTRTKSIQFSSCTSIFFFSHIYPTFRPKWNPIFCLLAQYLRLLKHQPTNQPISQFSSIMWSLLKKAYLKSAHASDLTNLFSQMLPFW